MAIAITPYTAEWTPAVRAFNQRLAAANVAPEFRFPESHIPAWLPKKQGRRIYQELYLAVSGDDVRGAYILKFQDFSLCGTVRPIAYYHLPLSEGIVDRAFSSVGVQMLRSAMKAQPHLYCLGMGGFDRPLPQMLKASGWHLEAVPFYFRVRHAARFLREIAPLRRTAGRRLLADFAAFTGIGSAAFGLLQNIGRSASDRSVTAEPLTGFAGWADELWEKSRRYYPMIASRDSATLETLYPAGEPFIRLQLRRSGQVIGWAVALNTAMRGNKYFGNLSLGSIVDCLALPEDAGAVLQASARWLDDLGADLIVCNHADAAWTSALKGAGFLAGPSNFIYAASKPLHELTACTKGQGRYLMRGDGDGPVNL
jgi:hypothetical protein